MGFRQIEIPALNRVLSNIMAHPSSADPETHERGLDEYARLGGNCIHVHAEGEETHTLSATGRWLQRHGCRQEFFVCTQICHAGWDEAAARPIDRFTAAAVSEDIDADLGLLGTEFLDLVYLDDNPQSPFEPVMEAIGREIGLARVRAFGVRNWDARRLAAAQEYLYAASLPRMCALFTTELALATASAPLWPEYVPFDDRLRSMVEAQGLAVFAHADDINLGQCLYSEEANVVRRRRTERWQHPSNVALVQRVKDFARASGLSTREVNIAWLLNQNFPSIAITSLPCMLERSFEYDRASQFLLNEVDRESLRGKSTPAVRTKCNV